MIVFVRGVYKPPKVEVCVPRDLEWQRSGTSNGGSGTAIRGTWEQHPGPKC